MKQYKEEEETSPDSRLIIKEGTPTKFMFMDLPTLNPGTLSNSNTVLHAMAKTGCGVTRKIWVVNLWYIHEPPSQKKYEW